MFLSLPTELVQHVLCFCAPQTLAALSQTCRLIFTLVYDTKDQRLWREVFLSVPFDDLRDSPDHDPTVPIDWKTELQRRIRASSVVAFTPDDLPLSEEMREQVLDAFEPLVKVAHSAVPPFRMDPDSPPVPSHNMRWLTDVLARCALFSDPERSTSFVGDSEDLQQLLAYWGTPLRGVPTGNLHTESRSFVYDLRHYTLESNWGVYRAVGTEQINETQARYIYEADWEHVKHCVNAVLFGIKYDGTGAFAHPPNPAKLLCPPMGFNSIRAYSAPGSFNRKPGDWAGVEGMWVRYVCFMDYSDLAEFNVSTLSPAPLPHQSSVPELTAACAHRVVQWSPTNGHCNQKFFSKPGLVEVLRSIRVEIQLLEPGDTPIIIAPPPVHADRKYPRLYFKGTGARMITGIQDDTVVDGHVDRYLDGTIQWTFVSRYGNVVWMFDGVQLGAVCSAAGVVGTWTSTRHLPGDPSGPSWMWKMEPQESQDPEE